MSTGRVVKRLPITIATLPSIQSPTLFYCLQASAKASAPITRVREIDVSCVESCVEVLSHLRLYLLLYYLGELTLFIHLLGAAVKKGKKIF